MQKLRFAVLGTGFWSNFQIPGWLESSEVELVALCDQVPAKAQALASKYGVPKVYRDADTLLANETLDFVDIITEVNMHYPFARKAADHGLDVVCQKPMAPDWDDAKAMLNYCEHKGVQLFINENFRWQAPLRSVKQLLDQQLIGRVFKGRVAFCSAFPVYDNQPFLKELEHFILTDIGSHTLDICRFLFGEVKYLYCRTQRVNPEIKGEDVANVLMEMHNGVHCYAEMSYASILEKEVFPQTLLLIEGELGSIELAADYTVKVTTKAGTSSNVIQPKRYDWIDPDYAVVHSSIVDTQSNIIEGLKGKPCETTGRDNLETIRLIWASYHSAKTGVVVEVSQFK